MSTGGPDYDGRKVAEARIMVDTALRSYPELAQKESGFLEKQLGSISLQQAQKDYNTAEFYRRTNRAGSAYFYYGLVRRRYPARNWRKWRLRNGRGSGEAEREQARPRSTIGEGRRRPGTRCGPGNAAPPTTVRNDRRNPKVRSPRRNRYRARMVPRG